ncbi:MAG: 2,3-bisphosphoglycerate-independent phosphoglycerate mutase [Patescibacteria group bacterium]|nr:MAG: 2,3-bisphosphoglycerate-independent phosphoglycerate mutase [Patescibacteria group bacterium]
MNTGYPLVVMLICDGFGIAPAGPGNAVTLAQMPNWRGMLARFPHGQLQASGEAVGLLRGEVGSTEVGHLNLGAGRIVYQDLPRINMSIAEGSFGQNEALNKAINHAKSHNSNIHLMGLCSNGNVHASIEHLYALLWLMREKQIPPEKVKVHAFLDGRDTPPTAGLMFITELQEKMKQLETGQIASIAGRYYAMDRDNRWERIEKAYNAIVLGDAETTTDLAATIQQNYSKGITDEFIPPTVHLNAQGQPSGLIQDHDAIIHFNFRADRPRELVKALRTPNFEQLPVKGKLSFPGTITTFRRKAVLQDLCMVTMTEYEKDMVVDGVAFQKDFVAMPLCRVLANHNKRHLHMAESEKERFPSFFFNGMREEPLPLEDRMLIPSPRVPTYDLKPEMSSYELTEKLIERINNRTFDFAVMNFACTDMVGHTGVLGAAIKACEALDKCLGEILRTVTNAGGAVVVTADHGNVEQMIDSQSGGPNTEHTSNPIPFLIAAKDLHNRHLDYGILADVAPTVLGLFNIPKPDSMTGRNLLPR